MDRDDPRAGINDLIKMNQELDKAYKGREMRETHIDRKLALKILLDRIMELECYVIERGGEIDHRFEIGAVAGIACIVRELYELDGEAKSRRIEEQ